MAVLSDEILLALVFRTCSSLSFERSAIYAVSTLLASQMYQPWFTNGLFNRLRSEQSPVSSGWLVGCILASMNAMFMDALLISFFVSYGQLITPEECKPESNVFFHDQQLTNAT